MIYRAKRKDNGELVHGYYLGGNGSWIVACGNTIQYDDYEDMLKVWGGAYGIDPATLAMSTGILDEKKVEIFGSFKVDGVMSKGGDRVLSGVNAKQFIVWHEGQWSYCNFGGEYYGSLFLLAEDRKKDDLAFEIIGTQMEAE